MRHSIEVLPGKLRVNNFGNGHLEVTARLYDHALCNGSKKSNYLDDNCYQVPFDIVDLQLSALPAAQRDRRLRSLIKRHVKLHDALGSPGGRPTRLAVA
jgi:hypothetical protein